jgi:hypothetical protein
MTDRLTTSSRQHEGASQSLAKTSPVAGGHFDLPPSAAAPSGGTDRGTTRHITNRVYGERDHHQKIRDSFSIHDDAHVRMPALVTGTGRGSTVTQEYVDGNASLVNQGQPPPNGTRDAR